MVRSMTRLAARAAVVLIVAAAAAGTGVASAEPDNGVTVGESFHIWPRNPQGASWNCWKAAQDHNTAIDGGDFDGIVDALDDVERYDCDVVPA